MPHIIAHAHIIAHVLFIAHTNAHYHIYIFLYLSLMQNLSFIQTISMNTCLKRADGQTPILMQPSPEGVQSPYKVSS